MRQQVCLHALILLYMRQEVSFSLFLSSLCLPSDFTPAEETQLTHLTTAIYYCYVLLLCTTAMYYQTLPEERSLTRLALLRACRNIYISYYTFIYYLYVYIYMYIYTHISYYTFICLYIYIQIHIYATHTYVDIYIYIYSKYIYYRHLALPGACRRIHTCVCACVCVCVCVREYIYVCVYKYYIYYIYYVY